MRIVVDTNVLVSSFMGGNPRAVIDLWKTGEVVLCLSGPVLDEYAKVLKRLGVGADELAEVFRLFRVGHHCVFAARTPLVRVVSDPDDDKFVECAVALDAAVIVSGDKALLDLRAHADIEILSPRQFLDKHHPGTAR
jgi:uncharacterized protein